MIPVRPLSEAIVETVNLPRSAYGSSSKVKSTSIESNTILFILLRPASALIPASIPLKSNSPALITSDAVWHQKEELLLFQLRQVPAEASALPECGGSLFEGDEDAGSPNGAPIDIVCRANTVFPLPDRRR